MVGPKNGDTTRFAQRLREYREQKHWSRQELATHIGVTPATVGNWENGRGFTKIGKRLQLCTLLGVTAKDLYLPPYDRDE